MDSVKDFKLVDFTIYKRLRKRNGKTRRYFVLSVNGDEFFCKRIFAFNCHFCTFVVS